MKYHLTLATLALTIFYLERTSAQVINLDGEHTTRAVVIGISDYQDEKIPDLRFADRDAEAFADWLRSPAGGSMASDQMTLLTNKDATTGKMIAALDWLISASKPGDDAIIYFSGHGDVERVTKFQRGFLLTYDSPPAVYAAGAFSLQYLQDIVTTLSEAGVQAVVITDACRAGKLAGSEFGGSKATSAALAQQFANEVKILSCQPEEFSLEGEQWGGGRGCFSYYLVDALYGMADTNADGKVNLLELGRYLEDKVTTETAPHSQIPFTVGSKSTQIASVDNEALAQWRQQKNGEAMAFKKIDSRGLEDLALAKADTGVLEMYHAFTAALDAGNLMATDSTAGKSADDYYKLLVQEPSIAELHGLMTRNFAAALMDEGQQVINLILKSDPQIMDNLWMRGRIDYKGIYLKLQRAAELLGERHYVYPTLKAKAYYFKAQSLAGRYFVQEGHPLVKVQKLTLLKGLEFDHEAAYILQSLIDYPIGISYSTDSLKLLSQQIDSLVPGWALGHYTTAGTFFGKVWREQIRLEELNYAIEKCEKAIAADSNFLPPVGLIGWFYESIGLFQKADIHRTAFVEKLKRQLAATPNEQFAFQYSDLGNALWRLRRYEEAIQAFKVADQLSDGKRQNTAPSLCLLYADLGRFEEALQQKFDRLDGLIYSYYLNDLEKAEKVYQLPVLQAIPELLDYYIKTGKLEKAGQAIDTLLSLDSTNWDVLFSAGQFYNSCGKNELAVLYYRKVAAWNRFDYLLYSSRIRASSQRLIALHRLGMMDELNSALEKFAMEFKESPWLHFYMACFYAQTNGPEKALAQLEKGEIAGWEPNPALWIGGTVKDPLLDPLRSLLAFQVWEQRWSPPYKDYSQK